MAQNERYDSLIEYLSMESELINKIKDKNIDKNELKIHIDSLRNLYLYHKELCLLWNYQVYLKIRRENDL